MTVTDRLDITEIANGADMEAAQAVRREVFCVEQGVSREEEFDGLDEHCRHYLARLGGEPVGTARARPLGEETKIERVAVLQRSRGNGIGRALMDRAIAEVERSGVRRIVLNAQCHAEPFYAALGFVAEGGVFDEAGIPHVRMVREIGRLLEEGMT